MVPNRLLILLFKATRHLVQIMAVGLLLVTTSYSQATTEEIFPEFKWDPITEEDWNPDLSWLDERPGAVVLFEKNIDDDRLVYYQTMSERIYSRVRILSEDGIYYANEIVTYYPDWENIIEFQARTILSDGSIFELTKVEIMKTEEVYGEDGKGRKVTVSFPNLDSNCIVEYNYGLTRKIGKRIFTYRDRKIQKKIPLILGYYTWYYADRNGPDDSYANLGYSWTTMVPVTDLTTIQAGAYSKINIARNVPAKYEEPMALPTEATLLQLWRYYGNDSPKKRLQQIAKSYQNPEPNDYDFGEKDKEEIHKAAERFRGIDSQEEIVEAVYRWLQDSIVNTTYYDSPPEWLSNQKGKKVKKLKENKHLRDALKNRYGSWRDIDCLFYRMMIDLGIKAWPTLVADRKERIFYDNAGFFQFERFVVAVLDSVGNYRYYSPGEYGIPPGKLHWSYEATDALLCDTGPTTVRIPASSPEQNLVIRLLSLEIRSDGAIEGKLTERHNGEKRRLCLARALAGKQEELREYFTDSLALLMPGVSATVDDIKFDSVALSPLEMQYSLRYDFYLNMSDSLIEFSPLLFAPDTVNLFPSPKRYGEIVFGYPYRAIDTVFFPLGSRQEVVTLPGDTMVVTEAGSCRVTFTSDSTRIIAAREFVLNNSRFLASAYPEVQKLFSARAELAHLKVELSLKN